LAQSAGWARGEGVNCCEIPLQRSRVGVDEHLETGAIQDVRSWQNAESRAPLWWSRHFLEDEACPLEAILDAATRPESCTGTSRRIGITAGGPRAWSGGGARSGWCVGPGRGLWRGAVACRQYNAARCNRRQRDLHPGKDNGCKTGESFRPPPSVCQGSSFEPSTFRT
jgi:hypothetical protein